MLNLLKPLKSGSLFFLIFLTVLLAAFSYFFLDRPITHFFYNTKLYQSQQWLYGVTFLGKHIFVLLLLFILLVYLQLFHAGSKRLWQCRYIFSSVLIANVIGGVCKISLGRARPVRWFEQDQYGFFGPALSHDFWSMPSGHTITVMALVFSCAHLWPKHRWWFLLLGVLLVATRIILIKHFLSDLILAGLLSYLVAHLAYFYGFKKYIETGKTNLKQ